MSINFNVADKEATLCYLIARRARVRGLATNLLEMEMDIVATHANGCRLDLEKLLTFADPDFSHDVLGIRQHISRETGKITKNFRPRSAADNT